MRRTDKLAPRLWARRHRRLTIFTGLLLILIALLGATYAWLAVDLPSPDELYHHRSAPSTRILDRQGRLLYEIIDPHTGFHQPLSLDEIPLACQQATIATEDANFYANPGVDLAGILRAAWINLRGGEVLAGGSTITQQLTRNLLLDPQERAERTLKRKLRESLLAWRIARRYDKDEILMLYLNETYSGGGQGILWQTGHRPGLGRMRPAGRSAPGTRAVRPPGRSPGCPSSPVRGAGSHAQAGLR